MPYDVFISYSSSDLAIAKAVHKRLAEAGFNVWFDKARLNPGCNWHKELEAGCENSRVVLPLLTPRWKLSEWTRYETYGAEAIIPLLAEGDWKDVSTPPLTPYQSLSIPIASATDADWQRVFDSIRELCAHEIPIKAERVQRLRFHPAKHFVGREKELDEIHEKLFVNPTAALTQGHVQAIAAMGGVGKTTLARQYAEKFWRCYPQMFWADCRLGLETEFAAIHDILRPEPVYSSLSTADKAGWVRYEFNQSDNRPRRLLIIDNAEDEESLLGWIPKTGNCHTLITSRFTGWSSGIDRHNVLVLDPESANKLLLSRSNRSDTPEERKAVEALAGKLEYLPLALEQAAAYVASQPPAWGFAEYLQLYAANEQSLLAERTPGATEYPDSVYLTWQATIDKLPQGARAILRLHAFMASTPTPVRMFVQSVDLIAEEAKHLAAELGAQVDSDIEGAGEFAVRKWVLALTTYSMALLEEPDSFSVHGLVHAVERHALEEKSVRVLEAALHCVDGAFIGDPQDIRNWRRLDALAPHALACAQFADTASITDPTSRLFSQMGILYFAQARHPEAEPLMRRALTICEATRGPDHPSIAIRLNNLVELFRATNRMSEAEPMLRRALAIDEVNYGPEHPVVAVRLNNLSLLLKATNRSSEAEPMLRRALSIDEASYGADHPEVARDLNNVASLLQDTNRHSEAEPLYRRALSISEECFGHDHPNVSVSLNNLSNLLRATNRLSEAEPFMRRALAIDEASLGPSHPTVAIRLSNLAGLLYATSRLSEAEPIYRRVVSIFETRLGSHHPSVASAINNLAELLRTTNRAAEAEPLYRRALSIDEASFGPDHPSVARDLNNFALLLQSANRHSEAEPLYLRALSIGEASHGADHPLIAPYLNNLASLMLAKGRPFEAESLYHRALSICEASYGHNHPEVAICLNNIARLLQATNRLSEAEQLSRRHVEILLTFSRATGHRHPHLQAGINNYGGLLMEVGRTREEVAATLREMAPELFGDGSPGDEARHS